MPWVRLQALRLHGGEGSRGRSGRGCPRSTGAPPALPPPLAGRAAIPPPPPPWRLGLFAPIGLVVAGRTTPETLVRQAQIPDEVDRPRSVRQVSRQLDVSTPLTPAAGHLHLS